MKQDNQHMDSCIGHCKLKLQRENFTIDVDFNIPKKGVLGIFGHSGSGKTTVLRCLAGLEEKAQGQITFNKQIWLNDRQQLTTQQRHLGYIFQESRLFPHMTVAANLDYGQQRNPTPANSHKLSASINKKQLLDLLNIHHLLTRHPAKLSGGEKRRVSIARALLKNPQLLLMDEPLAALDEKHKQEILPFLQCLHDETNIPIIYVSHSLEEVSQLCDQMVVMEQGEILFKGGLHETLVSPLSPLSTADNAAAIVEAKVIRHDNQFKLSTVETQSGNQLQIQGLIDINTAVRLRIQANNVSLCKTQATDSSILNTLQGTITHILEETESSILLQISSGKDILLSRISQKSYQTLQLAPQQSIFMQIKTMAIY